MDEQQQSWFKRNWLWFVPSMGCLILIILFALGIFGIFSMISGSEPSEFALERASKNTAVIEELGQPVEKYGITRGEMTFSTDSGSRVNLLILIKGPKGKGSITVKGYKENDEWIYEELYVLVEESQEKINLLKKTLEGI